ncbi:universal stress protein [Acidimangrovimonas sediminis]|uniref:universal stress protein n=1 Tax=Acidimangrovimonas sediminis TaxID=2056283 RepID=UPI000C802E5C|nr:universal stress protein [Acidimangrovimonas sediminis]
MELLVVATDGSEGSARAIDHAADFANRHGAALHLVNVIADYGLPSDLVQGLADSRNAWLEERLEQTSAEILRAGRDRALAAGSGPVVIESLHGDPAGAILAYARDKKASAVVIAKRGDGPIERLLLGSVATKLVSLADTVVVVVP